MCKTVPELKPLLHIANLLASEMIHFIHQLAYYITFEVCEHFNHLISLFNNPLCSR